MKLIISIFDLFDIILQNILFNQISEIRLFDLLIDVIWLHILDSLHLINGTLRLLSYGTKNVQDVQDNEADEKDQQE